MGAYERAIIIGVDGAGAFPSDTPIIDEFFAGYATTDRLLTANPTISAQCWGSLLTGVTPEIHQFTNATVATTRNTEFATIFKQVRERFPNAPLASFSHWSPINYGIVEENLNLLKATTDKTDRDLVDDILAYLDWNDPKLMFVQLDDVDLAGHTEGFGSDGYLQQIQVSDGYIGEIIDKLTSLNRMDDALFIVTSDHGGLNKSHGGLSDEEKYVFFGARGKTVNKTFLENMNIHDIPAIVAYALGAEAAQSWDSHIPENLFKDYVST